MPRPRKQRRLLHRPHPTIFKPVGLPLEALERVTLLHEELEALRLADLERVHQEEGARQMSISRSTFQRMVSEARYKVALALVNDKALQVEGGTFRVAAIRWHCANCGHDWDLIHGSGQSRPIECPVCGSHAIRERPETGRRHLE
jgi:predicted DNA-binding protein (UPF0251 family)/DNA-directed RNA polymerase subunit RPC12/RpoP